MRNIIKNLSNAQLIPGIHHFSNYLRVSCLLLLISIPGLCLAEPLIIHHPQLHGEDFSPKAVMRIYAMHKKLWSDGTPVKVYTLPSNDPVHKEFVNQFLRMQPYQLSRLWHRLVFSGTGSSPEEVSSAKQMIERVKNTPGSIGYIDSSMAGQIDKAMLAEALHE